MFARVFEGAGSGRCGVARVGVSDYEFNQIRLIQNELNHVSDVLWNLAFQQWIESPICMLVCLFRFTFKFIFWNLIKLVKPDSNSRSQHQSNIKSKLKTLPNQPDHPPMPTSLSLFSTLLAVASAGGGGVFEKWIVTWYLHHDSFSHSLKIDENI